jgi:hypothetical protein
MFNNYPVPCFYQNYPEGNFLIALFPEIFPYFTIDSYII